MENKIKNIKQNEKKISDLLIDKDVLMAELGELLIKNNIAFPDDDNTVRLVNELNVDIKTIRSEQDKINQYKKRIESISTDEKTALRKIKDIKGENEKHYIGIGETVYTIYLERPGELYMLNDDLKDLLELNDKIADIDDQIESRERKKDIEGFFSRIFTAGSGTVLESKKKLLENKFISLYKNLGKKLCDEKIYTTTEDKELKGVFSAYEANMKVVEDFEIKLDSLNAEKSNYQTEIDEKEKKLKTDYEKKADVISEDLKAELNGIFVSAGVSFSEALKAENGEVNVDNSDISGCLEKIEDIEIRREKLIEVNEKLQREIEIDKKQKEIERLKESVHEKQDKAKNLKKEIDKMNRAAKKLEKEIDELSGL